MHWASKPLVPLATLAHPVTSLHVKFPSGPLRPDCDMRSGGVIYCRWQCLASVRKFHCDPLSQPRHHHLRGDGESSSPERPPAHPQRTSEELSHVNRGESHQPIRRRAWFHYPESHYGATGGETEACFSTYFGRVATQPLSPETASWICVTHSPLA